MIESELQQYLYDHIPQSAAMQVKVESIGKECTILSAPLEANINHRDSVFGGSASSIAILTAWSHLHCRMKATGVSPTLVIQRNTMGYDHPILGRFTAVARLAEDGDWSRFLAMLERRKRARIRVVTHLEYEGKTAGVMEGDFVALLKD